LRFFLSEAEGFSSQAIRRATLASFLPSSPTPRGRSKRSRIAFSVAAKARSRTSFALPRSASSGNPEKARMFFLITVALPGVR
jgi:hypothetical protein